MATQKFLTTQMEYNQAMKRFVIRVNSDVEQTLPQSILDSMYKGLRGRALKREIYRKAFEIVNAQTLNGDALEQFFAIDNRGV
jgi:hypothetical protein